MFKTFVSVLFGQAS